MLNGEFLKLIFKNWIVALVVMVLEEMFLDGGQLQCVGGAFDAFDLALVVVLEEMLLDGGQLQCLRGAVDGNGSPLSCTC
jgi:hypothetical protein